MLVNEVAKIIEQFAPLQLQESYDNSGLCIGNPEQLVTGVLITIDVTEPVIDEAIQQGCNLIISHHPLIFSGIKKITGKTYTEKCIIKAIQNNIAIYSAHTNIDLVSEGVSKKMCDKLGLINCQVLVPIKDELRKLVTFIPTNSLEKVQEAIFKAGAGHIGNYDKCSFIVEGKGSFRGNENTNPFVGEKGKLHFENETRIETVFPKFLEKDIIKALLAAHPYQEVAYDIYPIENSYSLAGMGMIGELSEEIEEIQFLQNIKSTFNAQCIKHTPLKGRKIKKIAVCGGSGSSFLPNAIQQGADVFISADFKYHQFFDTENKITIADIGHYESEQFTKEIFYDLLTKNFSNFAVRFSSINTNPINYL